MNRYGRLGATFATRAFATHTFATRTFATGAGARANRLGRALARSATLRRALFGMLLAVSPLVGCDRPNRFTDSYNAPGTWHAAGANELNIAAQVADPNDLVRGRGDASGNLRTGAAAVADMWAGKPAKPVTASVVGTTQ